MRALLASLLGFALQALVSSPVQAFPVSFAIDLSFPFESGATEGALAGTFPSAGSFHVESSLLPARGSALISFGQLSDFHLRLPDFTIGTAQLDGGSCNSAAQLPVCGFLFTDGQVRGLVGQFSLPTSDLRFAFRFDNTSPTLFDTSAIFQSVSLEDVSRGIVSSGFVAVRPLPEPTSTLLLGGGAALTALAARRRMRPAALRSRP